MVPKHLLAALDPLPASLAAHLTDLLWALVTNNKRSWLSLHKLATLYLKQAEHL